MTVPLVLCICGHTKIEHTNPDSTTGPCQEPTQRCACVTYTELCPRCQHGQTAHIGAGNMCAAIKTSTKLACGCTHYLSDTA